MNIKKAVKECKRRFPVGTKVEDCYNDILDIATSRVFVLKEDKDKYSLWMNSDKGDGDIQNDIMVMCCNKGEVEWAKVIECVGVHRPQSNPNSTPLPFPKRMLCWDEGENSCVEYFVINKVSGRYQCVTLDDISRLQSWDPNRDSIELLTFKYAKDLPKEVTELRSRIKKDNKRLNQLLNK